MQKLGFPAIKGLDHLKSLGTSNLGSLRAVSMSNGRSSSNSSSYGSFANLKLTAEKMVKEQASVKTDLEMAHSKLKKAAEQIHGLESKLQQVVNENAKLKAKQTEDAKLWKGLDSKFSSTKALCDQLTEILQVLAGQTRQAEEDKKIFEEKLEKNSKSVDNYDFLVKDLHAKLDCASRTIDAGQQEILELRHIKEEMEKSFRSQQTEDQILIKDKDAVIKRLEETGKESGEQLYSLESQLQVMMSDMKLRDDTCECLRVTIRNLECVNSALQVDNRDYAEKLDNSNKKLEEIKLLYHGLILRIAELDKQNTTVSENVVELLSSLQTYENLVQIEKNALVASSQKKYAQLQEKFVLITSEKNGLRLEIEQLSSKVVELQKSQEFAMVQHADECRLAEDKIRNLESEIEDVVSKKNELEKLTSEVQEKTNSLSDAASLMKSEMEDLVQKLAKLELENHNLSGKMQSMIQEKAKDSEVSQDEISKRDQQINSLEGQLIQLQISIDEKDNINRTILEREKHLVEQNAEIQASLAAAESKLLEARKQCDLMLEGKQLELSRHLKEISQRNDQAITEIRKKYELEKVDIATAEKDKAEKLIKEMERNCDERVFKNQVEIQQQLMQVKEEHAAMLYRIQEDFNEKEANLRACQKGELQRIQLQAENEMRERMSSLKKEHEIEVKALKMQHDDDYTKMQDELELQKSKEEKQRALLKMQWKVMSENQQVEQEVNSKKEFSVSSRRMRNPYREEHQLALASPESRKKDIGLSGIMQTPITNILKKTETGITPGSVPKRSRKVTHHEYEVQTSNGGTITKRRKTKSTVMFGGTSASRVRRRTPRRTPTVSEDVVKTKKVMGTAQPEQANLGDLFSEGSLNPYNDDPYAFD